MILTFTGIKAGVYHIPPDQIRFIKEHLTYASILLKSETYELDVKLDEQFVLSLKRWNQQ